MVDFVNLQADEKVIARMKPLTAIKKIWFVMWVFLLLIAFGFMFSLIASFFAKNIGDLLWWFVAAVFMAATISWVLVNKEYENEEYLVTTKRVIRKQGALGYTVHSVPLERITDVHVSRTFIENLLGFGSIRIETMAGQISRTRGGAGMLFAAVSEPEKLQETIFELLKKKRSDEKLTF